MAIENRYNDFVDVVLSSQQGEIAVSTQQSSTDKLKAYREEVYRDTHQDVNQQSQPGQPRFY